MGKNYHCEYCNKTFKDVLGVRKTHLKGALHQQMKKEHYDRFRDIETLVKEETAKEPCSRLLKNLDCNFGSRCRFSHYMPWELKNLESMDKEKKARIEYRTEVKLNEFIARLEHKYGNNIMVNSPSNPESCPESMRTWKPGDCSESQIHDESIS